MTENIEMGSSTHNPIAGIDSHEIIKDPSSQKVEPTKKHKIPIANIERFHLNYQSLRDVQYAVQITTSFVFCTLVIYTSNYASTLAPGDLQHIVPILGVALMTETCGGTLLLCILGTLIFTFSCCVMAIIQAAGVGYQDYASSTILFFLVTFFIGFTCPNIAIRKAALLLPACIFVTLVTSPPQYLPNNFIWNIYVGALIAVSFVIAVTLLIFPRFACLEAQDRLSYSLSHAGEIFRLIDLAVLSTNSASASDLISEAESLMENMKNNQLVLNARVHQTKLEPKAFLRKHFRKHQSMFNRLSIEEMGETGSSVLWHLQSALHAVKKVNFNENHAIILAESKEVFSNTHTKFSDVIQLLACSSAKEPHDVVVINAAVLALQQSCDKLGLVLASSFLKKKGDNDQITATTDIKIDFDPTASTTNNGMVLSFYLFHMSEMIRLINERFGISDIQAAKNVPAKEPKKHVSLGTKIKILLKRHGWEYAYNGIRTSFILGVALVFVEVPYLEQKFEHGIWILLAAINSQNDNNGSTVQHMRSRVLGAMFGALYSYFTYLAVGNVIWVNLDGINIFPTSSPSITLEPTMSPGSLATPSFNPSFAPISVNFSIPPVYSQIGMFVPLLFFGGIIRQNKNWSYFGFVSIMTAIVISFGRVLGVNYPYFGTQALGDYVILLRIEENIIGVLIVFLVSFLSFPILATDLLKINIMDTLVKFTVAVTKSWSVYDRSINGANTVDATPLENDIESPKEATDITDQLPTSGTVKPIDEIQAISQLREEAATEHNLRVECEDIHNSLVDQDLLIGNSVLETIFWCKPFSAAAYQQLLRVESSLLTLLFSFDRISNIISKLVHLKAASQMVEIASSLHGDFTQLTREVYYILEESHQLTEKSIFFTPIKFHLPFPLVNHGTDAHPSPEVQEINHVPIYTENETCDPTELSRLLSDNDDNDASSKTSIYIKNDSNLLQLDPTLPKAQIRIKHRTRLQHLNRIMSNITVKVGKINDQMTVSWAADILGKVIAVGNESSTSSDAVAPSIEAEKGAAARYLISVQTTFNAYFYASTNFASTLEEMSNIVFTSTELRINHQAF